MKIGGNRSNENRGKRATSVDRVDTGQTRSQELSLPRTEFVLANHLTRNAHVISGNALL